MKKIFITGTDTGVGKTRVTAELLKQFAKQDIKACGFKPIASGAERIDGELRNDDALQLQQASPMSLPYDAINPWCFEPAIAPHIAASQVGVSLEFNALTDGLNQLETYSPDLVLIEGAGGWHLPLGQGRFLSEWVSSQELDVILVVGIRLGCLNHAMLTAQAIAQSGARLIGWVANHVDPDMPFQSENIALLSEELDVPNLATMPFNQSLATKTGYDSFLVDR